MSKYTQLSFAGGDQDAVELVPTRPEQPQHQQQHQQQHQAHHRSAPGSASQAAGAGANGGSDDAASQTVPSSSSFADRLAALLLDPQSPLWISVAVAVEQFHVLCTQNNAVVTSVLCVLALLIALGSVGGLDVDLWNLPLNYNVTATPAAMSNAAAQFDSGDLRLVRRSTDSWKQGDVDIAPPQYDWRESRRDRPKLLLVNGTVARLYHQQSGKSALSVLPFLRSRGSPVSIVHESMLRMHDSVSVMVNAVEEANRQCNLRVAEAGIRSSQMPLCSSFSLPADQLQAQMHVLQSAAVDFESWSEKASARMIRISRPSSDSARSSSSRFSLSTPSEESEISAASTWFKARAALKHVQESLDRIESRPIACVQFVRDLEQLLAVIESGRSHLRQLAALLAAERMKGVLADARLRPTSLVIACLPKLISQEDLMQLLRSGVPHLEEISFVSDCLQESELLSLIARDARNGRVPVRV